MAAGSIGRVSSKAVAGGSAAGVLVEGELGIGEVSSKTTHMVWMWRSGMKQ